MPWSMTSAMSSGGVSSIVALIASTIESIDGSMASRICALVTSIDRGSRLFHQTRPSRAGGDRGILHRALLDLGDAGRDADDHARTRIQQRALAVHLADEVVEHLFGDVEVADDAVLERTDGDDARRRAPDHPLRLGADREHRAGPLILRDDRRLGDDDPAPAHVYEGVGGAEVDADVPREQAEETVEQRWGYPFQARSHVHAKDNGAARQNARGFRVWASVSRRSRSRTRRWRSGEARRLR